MISFCPGKEPHCCENVFVAGVQRFLRRDSQDDFAGFKSFMYGTSVANQVCDKFKALFFW